ncbi:MAG: homocysteine S-methyltransferase family protein [Candidatus Eisenbacteria bacterium]
MRQLLDGALGCWTARPATASRGAADLPAAAIDLHAAYLRAGASLVRSATFTVTHRLAHGGSEEETRTRLLAGLGAIAEAEARTGVVATRQLLSIGPSGLPATAEREARAVYARLASVLPVVQAELRAAGRSFTLLLESFRAWREVELALESFGGGEAWLFLAPREGGGLADLDLGAAATRARGAIHTLGLGCHDEGTSVAPALRALEEQFDGPLAVSLPAFGNGAEWAAATWRLARDVPRVLALGGCCGTGPGHIAALRDLALAGIEEERRAT